MFTIRERWGYNPKAYIRAEAFDDQAQSLGKIWIESDPSYEPPLERPATRSQPKQLGTLLIVLATLLFLFAATIGTAHGQTGSFQQRLKQAEERLADLEELSGEMVAQLEQLQTLPSRPQQAAPLPPKTAPPPLAPPRGTELWNWSGETFRVVELGSSLLVMRHQQGPIFRWAGANLTRQPNGTYQGELRFLLASDKTAPLQQATVTLVPHRETLGGANPTWQITASAAALLPLGAELHPLVSKLVAQHR